MLDKTEARGTSQYTLEIFQVKHNEALIKTVSVEMETRARFHIQSVVLISSSG